MPADFIRNIVRISFVPTLPYVRCCSLIRQPSADTFPGSGKAFFNFIFPINNNLSLAIILFKVNENPVKTGFKYYPLSINTDSSAGLGFGWSL